jgi:hypothetical protein
MFLATRPTGDSADWQLATGNWQLVSDDRRHAQHGERIDWQRFERQRRSEHHSARG